MTGARELVLEHLVRWARTDPRVTGAALVGSLAGGTEDAWSDVDLFLGVAHGPPVEVLHELSRHLYADLGALHHFDLTAGAACYRAFLLNGPLEVDVGVAPVGEFRSYGEAPFRVLFGPNHPAGPSVPADVDHLAGLIWHHLLHARSSIERDRPWEAEHWISAVRDHVLTLASHRHGLQARYAKGAASLPGSLTQALEGSLVRSLEPAELRRALRVVADLAIAEVSEHHLFAPRINDLLRAIKQ